MKKIAITLFACRSHEGLAFAEQLKERIGQLIDNPTFETSSLQIIERGSQYDMLKATLHDDLVIFDGSLENDIDGNWCSQYEAATANVISNDNIAVVSRTVLPINYMPFHTNVPPFGSQGDRYTYRFTNDSIFQWLEETVRAMKKAARFPRPASLTFDLPPFEEITEKNASTLIKQMNRITEENAGYIHRSRKHKNSAFISYRSYYCRHTSNGWNVEKLADYIKQYHREKEGESWEVIYYPSGVLSSELMPEFRRWGFISYVDRTFRDTDEVWIFNTPDHECEAGYFDSWWTQGEIISLMYIKKYTPEQLPTIYLFDPAAGNARQMPESFIPDLSEEVGKELVRYFCNSDFLSGGVESLAKMRLLRPLPDKKLKEVLPYISELMQTVTNGFSEKNLQEGITLASLKNSLSSHTYDLSFVENRIIVCPNCFRKGTSIDDLKHPSFLLSYMNVNCDRAPSYVKGVHIITPESMEQIIQQERWECPQCRTRYAIRENPTVLLALWWSIRMGQHTGPDGCVIEKIPVYEIQAL